MTNTFRNSSAILGCLAAIVVFFGFPARDASATTERWHWDLQYLYYGGVWAVGYAHSITDNTAYVTGLVCVSAIDVNGGQLSGTGVCGQTGYVSHGFNGQVLRDPVVYPPNERTAGTVLDAYESY